MKTINAIVPWFAAICLLASLVSCDPLSSADFKLYNKTDDTVTVEMYKEILKSSYGGYTVIENDSVSTSYGQDDSVSVAILAPDQVLWVHNEWNGLYREEQIVPFWKYIRSIKAGEKEFPTESWDNEAAWHLKTEGGKKFQGESRYYSIILRFKQ